MSKRVRRIDITAAGIVSTVLAGLCLGPVAGTVDTVAAEEAAGTAASAGGPAVTAWLTAGPFTVAGSLSRSDTTAAAGIQRLAASDYAAVWRAALPSDAPLRLEFGVPGHRRLVVAVGGDGVDPVLHALDSGGNLLGADDDSGGGFTARLVLAPLADGRLRLVVSAAHDDQPGSVDVSLWALDMDAAVPQIGPAVDRRACVAEIGRAVERDDDRLLLDAFRGWVTACVRDVGADSALALLDLDQPELAPLGGHAAADILIGLGQGLVDLEQRLDRQALMAAQAARDAAATRGEEVYLGFAHLLAGTAHLVRNDPDIAILELDRAVPLLDRHGQRDLAARARYQTARALLSTDTARAGELFEAAAAAWLRGGELARAALATIDRGSTYRYLGNEAAAQEAFSRAAAWTRLAGDERLSGMALNALGASYRRDARFEDAAAAHRRALELAQRLGSRGDAATALLGLARLARARGAYGVAIGDAELAHALAQQAGQPHLFIEAQLELGNVATRLDDPAAADRFLNEARRLASLYGFQDLVTVADGLLGKASAARPLTDRGMGRLSNAVRSYESAGNLIASTDLEIDLAMASAVFGRLTEAEEKLRLTEQVIERLPGTPGLLRLRAMRGRVWREEGRVAESLREIDAAAAMLEPGDHGSGWRIELERARTLVALGRGEEAGEAYARSCDHIARWQPHGERGFDAGVRSTPRLVFDEAITHSVDRGAFDRALELALMASELEYRARWSARMAGLDRDGSWVSAWQASPVRRPAVAELRAGLERLGVQLLVQRATPERFVSWVVPAPGGLAAASRPAERDSLVIWNARLLDSLSVGVEPAMLDAFTAQVWSPVAAWVDPGRPLVVLPDLAVGYLPLEVMARAPGTAAAAGEDASSGSTGDTPSGGARWPDLVYVTRPGGLLELAGREAPLLETPANAATLRIAQRGELPFGESRASAFGDWAAAQGIELIAPGEAASEAQLARLVAGDVALLDLAYPCHVERSRPVRTGLATEETYAPPEWQDATIGDVARIPALVEDGRLAADEVLAARGTSGELVTLRTVCIEGDAMPSATLVEGFLGAGARAVLLPRWGGLGEPGRVDALLREVYAATASGHPTGEALRMARQQVPAGHLTELAAAAWAVFIEP